MKSSAARDDLQGTGESVAWHWWRRRRTVFRRRGPYDGGVIDVEDAARGQSGSAPTYLSDLTKQPLQQVEAVNRLVDQHAAAAAVDLAAPRSCLVIGLWAVPEDRG